MGFNPTGQPFNQSAISLYQTWSQSTGPTTSPTAQARQSIARGETIFNTRTFTITNVAGFNDVLGQPAVVGTCSTCHDAPNVASHSFPLLMHTGVADANRRTPDMPLYTFRCNLTGATIQTMDPGRGLITGKCADIGKFKVPALRGLETRSPYFHDGSAGELQDVIDFYDTRFSIGFSQQEQTDLINFLGSL